jgi:hypothetical protein
MNVWAALPRLLASSRCPHNVRCLVEEKLPSSIRHFSTNTPVSTKTPEDSDSQFSELLKRALEQADSRAYTQHSAPRLRSTSDLALSSFKKKRRKKASKGEKREKKAASQKDTKRKQRESRESTLKPLSKELQDAIERRTTPPSSQDPEETRWLFPSEKWVAEPWASSSLLQQNDERPTDERPTDDLDRPSPPHILDQNLISEGTLIPSVTNILIDVPAVTEHLPIATLSHGLDRVLFKYVIYLWLDFLMTDKSAAPVSIGYETRVRGCITSLHG